MRAWLVVVGATQCIGCGRVAFDGGPDASNASDAFGASDVADAPTELAGLIAHWKLDETMGTVARDAQGATDGVLSAGSSVIPAWTPGHRAGALEFGGDGDRVLMGTPPVITNLPALTVTAWIRPSSIAVPGGAHCIVDKGSPNEGWAFGIAQTADGDVWFHAPRATTTVERISVGALVATAQWQHVAASWDGGIAGTGISIYVNGAQVAIATSNNANGARPDDSTLGITLNNNGSTGYAGAIDDVQLYNRVLTPAEVASLYNATK